LYTGLGCAPFEGDGVDWDIPCTLDLGVHHLRVMVLMGMPSLEEIISPSRPPEGGNTMLVLDKTCYMCMICFFLKGMFQVLFCFEQAHCRNKRATIYSPIMYNICCSYVTFFGFITYQIKHHTLSNYFLAI